MSDFSPDRESFLALHAAVDVDPLWRALNTLLREFFPCHRVTLFLGHIGMHEARKVYSDPPFTADRDYYARRAEANPFSKYIEANVGVPHYRFSDIAGPPKAFRQTAFYRQFAEPEGWDKGLSGLVWLGSELRGMFSPYRGPDETDFSDDEVTILGRLLPLIAIALDRVQRLHRERLYRTVLEDFNRNMPVGLLLLDWELRIIYANTETFRLCADWNLGPDEGKRYNSRDVFNLPDAIRQTCAALKERVISLGPEAVHELGREATYVVPAPEGINCGVQPIRLPNTNIAKPGFFVTFENRAGKGAHNTQPISQEKIILLNHLSPSERELALLVGEGLSNREIADRLSKSVLTVKKQLNSAFTKLNISNRARLIALLR